MPLVARMPIAFWRGIDQQPSDNASRNSSRGSFSIMGYNSSNSIIHSSPLSSSFSRRDPNQLYRPGLTLSAASAASETTLVLSLPPSSIRPVSSARKAASSAREGLQICEQSRVEGKRRRSGEAAFRSCRSVRTALQRGRLQIYLLLNPPMLKLTSDLTPVIRFLTPHIPPLPSPVPSARP